MIDKILIPFTVIGKIDTYENFEGKEYNIGDIFLFNPADPWHIQIKASDRLQYIDNSLCDFIVEYPNLEVDKKIYEIGEKFDTSNVCQEAINCLVDIGYISKEIKKEKPDTKQNIKTKTTKSKSKAKTKPMTYSKFAKELNLNSKDFKNIYKETFGEDLQDMRKNISANKKKKITQTLKQK